MAISLKSVNTQLAHLKTLMTTAQANAYIRDRGTCNDTTHLNGQRLTHYRCNGSCSWSSSGR